MATLSTISERNRNYKSWVSSIMFRFDKRGALVILDMEAEQKVNAFGFKTENSTDEVAASVLVVPSRSDCPISVIIMFKIQLINDCRCSQILAV